MYLCCKFFSRVDQGKLSQWLYWEKNLLERSTGHILDVPGGSWYMWPSSWLKEIRYCSIVARGSLEILAYHSLPKYWMQKIKKS